MGLFIDQNGIPISFDLFPGNTQDKTTFKEMIKSKVNKFNEDSFRVIKSNLDGRPIYVWTNEHIHAHFLICFIALTIIRIWQHKVLRSEGKNTLNTDGWECGITAEAFANSLAGFNADRVSEEYYKVVKPDKNIEKLLRIVNSNRDLRFPTEHTIRQLKSDISKYRL